MITQDVRPDGGLSPAPADRVARVTGWLLVIAGAAWLLVGLWAILFVYLVDRGETEMVTGLFNLAIPLVLTLPGISVLRAGLRRVGPLDLRRLSPWRQTQPPTGQL
jgi:hypothetical protein